MKIILATGTDQLDDLIVSNIDAEFLGVALFRESVVEVVERKKPDVLILCDLLEGVMEMKSLVLTLRTRVPDTRIIYILKDENPKMKSFLFQWLVFDVFTGNLTMSELKDALDNPKKFKDVSKEIVILKEYAKNPNLDDEFIDINDLNGDFNTNSYSKMNTKSTGNSELYRQTVSFWSILDQSGKTFSITNTALTLASRSDLKILVVDFNIDNPNINLYYNFVDANRNLGALVDDLILEDDEINEDNFDDYLITHPIYPNLKILSGYILKMKRQSDEFMSQTFDFILELADKNSFSTILIDLKSGLSPLNKHILDKSNKILLHVNENPGSLNVLYRFFDTQFGPFVSSFIDKNKILPIVNNSHPDTVLNFKKAVHSFLDIPIVASFPFSDNVRISVQKGLPILSKKTNDENYLGFIRLSNAIHPNSFQEPNVKTISLKEKNSDENTKQDSKINSVTNKMKDIFSKNKKS